MPFAWGWKNYGVKLLLCSGDHGHHMTPVCCGLGVAGSLGKSSRTDTAPEAPDRVRADALLVARGLAASRERARALIAASAVLLAGKTLTKASRLLPADAVLELMADDFPWVSRGALKLIGGLDAFSRIDPAGRICLDIGASTGGFTEVLLTRGAARVVALDVGHAQLHSSLASDPRVLVMDGVNARDLTPHMLESLPDLIVCDASFISLVKLLPPALTMAPTGACLLALIKPQFEVGRGNVGKGGVVRDPALHALTTARIERWLTNEMGWAHIGTTPSPIDGPDGNREFLIAASKPAG